MSPPDSQPFSTSFYVWLAAGTVAFVLFFIGVKLPKLPYRGFAACIGALACFVSMTALTEIIRSGTTSMFGSVSVLVMGIGLSLVVSLSYAFFFTFWYVKNF